MSKDGSFRSRYVSGDSNTIDDDTGQKVNLSEVRQRWDGCYVTSDNWEERQPQDFPRTPRTPRAPKNYRNDPGIEPYTAPDKSTLGSE